MMRLALREVVAQYRTWLGFMVIAAASSAVVFLALASSESAGSLSPSETAAVRSFTSPALGMSVLAAVVVLSANTSLALRNHRRAYALWRLGGASPAHVVVVAAVQIFVFALTGIVVGIGVGTLASDTAFRLVLDQAVAGTAERDGMPSWSVGGTSAVVSFVSILISSLGGLNSIRLVEPLTALEQSDHRTTSVGPFRFVLAVVSAGVGVALVATLMSTSARSLSQVFSLTVGLSVLFCISLTALVAALGSLVFPIVLRAWTAVIPAALSSAWYLARNACLFHLTRSGAAIAPIVVAVATTAGTYTVFLTAAGAQAASGAAHASGIDDRALVLVLGGPLLISTMGAAATMFMTGSTRHNELGLLSAVGAPRSMLLRSIVGEAVIYCGTSTIVAGGIVAVVGLVVAFAFGRVVPGVEPAYGLVPALLVIGASLVIVVIAVLGPAARTLSATSPSRFANR